MGQAPLASPNIPPSVRGVFGVNFPPLNPQLLCLQVFGKSGVVFVVFMQWVWWSSQGGNVGKGLGRGGKMGNQGEELGTSRVCDPSKLAVLVPSKVGTRSLVPFLSSWVPQTTPPIAWHAPCRHPNAPKTFFIITPQRAPRGQVGCVGHRSPHPT